MKNLRVLVFQNDLDLRRSMRTSLVRWGYEVVTATDLNILKRILNEEPPQIAIIDCSTGFNIAEKIRKLFADNTLFILAITGDDRQASLITAIEAGANDCLTEPFEEKELEVRLRAAQRMVELERSLTAKACMDALTGIWNRAAIIQSLEKELARSRRKDTYTAIAMVDLDHFKKINDIFGHFGGDEVLKLAVQRMLDTLRAYDVLGRYGGEEFLIILPGCDFSAVLRVAERIREHLARTKFTAAGHEITVTASIGVAFTKAAKIESQLLIELADQALYRAKAAGRNRVEAAFGVSEDVTDPTMTRAAVADQLNMEITRRKQMEESLRNSEERLRLISKATNDAIWDWDLISNQIWTSEEKLFGYPEDTRDGSLWSEKIHPEDAERVLHEITRVIEAHEDFWSAEYRYHKANGTYASVLDRGYVLYDESGKAVRMMGAIIDITERKRSEIVQSALYRISEASNAARDMPQLYSTIHSIVGELMYAANFYIALYVPETNMISFPYWVDEAEPIAPDPLKVGKGLTAYVIRTGKPLLSTAEDWEEFRQTDEVELVGAYSLDWLGVPLISGEETIGAIVVQSYSESIRFSEKDKELLTFVSQHIATALKRKKAEADRNLAEEALRESEEKYRTLFEESRDPIFISTPEGKLLDINPAGVILFGYSSLQEMININTADLFQDPAERIAYQEAIKTDGYLKDFELHLKRKDGQNITVVETASVVKNEKGAPVAYRGVMRDITNLKLLQEQLLQSQKLETVGRLAGGVAHDFNNLLMAISGYCDLIDLQYVDDPLLLQYMQEIQKATERGAGLTRQLLAFSRKQIITLIPLDLNNLITNMDRMIDRMLGENIKLVLQLQPGIRRILGDQGQIEQVIMNLVVNARDAMPGGGVLTIETSDKYQDVPLIGQQARLNASNSVVLRITDTGCGMDETTQSRIFEPFFSTKELGKGTGLGLATVYGIVQQMGGQIVVSSKPEKGSCFEVFFPHSKDSVEASDPSMKETAESIHGLEVVLLVDDNETVRAAISSSLSQYGYHVLQASDGIDALRTAWEFNGKVDLLITDVVMPKMNGVQLGAKLTEKWPDIKIIYMSGYADEGLVEKGRMEAATFLQKPVSTKSLLTKMRQLLD